MNPCSLVIPGKTGWRAWQWWESMLGKLPGWEYTYIHTYINIYILIQQPDLDQSSFFFGSAMVKVKWFFWPMFLVWDDCIAFLLALCTSGALWSLLLLVVCCCSPERRRVHCGHCFYLLCAAAPLSEEGCIVIIASTCCVLLLLWAKKGALWTLLFLFVVSCSSSEQRSLEPEATKLEPNWYN
jgi:hypothetical protein